MNLRTAVKLCGLSVTLFLLTVVVPVASAQDAVTKIAPVTVSGPTPFTATCTGVAQTSLNYLNAEVEPRVAVNPKDPTNIIGVWQQDRWSDGGANGLLTGVSHDGGKTWTRIFAAFSTCAGGTSQNGGGYERSSDPWVTFTPNGDAYQISLSFTDSNNSSAILVSKSSNGGDTWGAPVALKADVNPTDGGFNDKEAITADPNDAKYVYAVWDRGTATDQPMWFSRTTDGGATWEQPKIIRNPATTSFVIGSQIVVRPNGDLIALYASVGAGDREEPGRALTDTTTPGIFILRSTDKGGTWSEPIKVADFTAVGVVDPKTGQDLRTADIIPDIAVNHKTGALYVTWQDGRFSKFNHEAIAFAKSLDGGLTWSKPKRISRSSRYAAFTPTISVADDGTIGVSYYDFRKFKKSSPTLATNYWLATSRNGGKTWHETALYPSFDMRIAPYARGLFVGDYQGLASAGNTFVALFVAANTGQTANRTDVYSRSVSTKGRIVGATYAAADAPADAGTPPVLNGLTRLRQHSNRPPR